MKNHFIPSYFFPLMLIFLLGILIALPHVVCSEEFSETSQSEVSAKGASEFLLTTPANLGGQVYLEVWDEDNCKVKFTIWARANTQDKAKKFAGLVDFELDREEDVVYLKLTTPHPAPWEGSNYGINATLYAGLYLNDTRNVTVENNSFTMNERWGVYLGNASDAKVFHNRFIGNGEQALQGPNVTASAWDDGYPSGGNYWSDYAGIDADGDGIGDTSYSIPQGAEDRYPFMNEGLEFVPEFGIIVYPVLGVLALFGAVAYRRRIEKG